MAEIVDFGLQQHKIKMDSRYFENVLSVVAGDTGRRLEVQLLDTNGMVQNTTGLNLRLNALVAGKATFTDATLADAVTGKYQLDLSNGMFLAPGNWQFQWQITDSAGKKLHSFAFTGNVGKNISEGGSQATNFYLNLEDLKAMQDDLVNGTVTTSKTDFADTIEQLVNQSTVITSAYWQFGSSGNVTEKTGSGYSRYPEIKIKQGVTYYVTNVLGVFSGYSDSNNLNGVKLSAANSIGEFEFVAPYNGYLYLTTSSTVVNNPKAVNTTKARLRELYLDINNLNSYEKIISISDIKVEKGQYAENSIESSDVDFILNVKQIIDTNKLNSSAYWLITSSNTVETRTSTDYKSYPRIPVRQGEIYYIPLARLYFSALTDMNGTVVRQLSTTDVSSAIEVTVQVDGYLYLTTKTNELPLKVFNQQKKYISDDYKTIPYGDYKNIIPIVEESFVKRTNTLTVGVDFATLKSTVENSTHATKENRVEIIIPQGTYDLYSEFGGKTFLNEIDASATGEKWGINLPDYVDLKGQGDVVLNFLVPDEDASVESAKRISGLNINLNNNVENIKVYVKNVRYAVHDETNNGIHNTKRTFKDCYFKHLGNRSDLWQSTQAYAIGTGSNGEYNFDNCIFESNTIPFSAHNNSNQKSNRFKLKNCSLIAGNNLDPSLRLGTYGQNSQMNYFHMDNCKLNNGILTKEEQANSGDGNLFKITGAGNSIVPYENINSAGEKVRIEFNEEVRTVYNGSSSAMIIGTPVKLKTGNVVVKAASSDTPMFYGVVLQNIPVGSYGLIKKTGFLNKLDSGISTIVHGDKIGVGNGVLSVVTSGDYIGFAVDNNTILLK